MIVRRRSVSKRVDKIAALPSKPRFSPGIVVVLIIIIIIIVVPLPVREKLLCRCRGRTCNSSSKLAFALFTPAMYQR